MALNMLREDKEVKCPHCNNITFKEEDVFILSSEGLEKSESLRKISVRKQIVCTKCGNDIRSSLAVTKFV